jgi:hypothetical protein
MDKLLGMLLILLALLLLLLTACPLVVLVTAPLLLPLGSLPFCPAWPGSPCGPGLHNKKQTQKHKI